MSQIDRLNFIPNLFWFLILFFLFYLLVFSYILPLIYQTLKIRERFLTFIINENLMYDIFYFIHTMLYNGNVLVLFLKIFLNFLRLFTIINFINFHRTVKLSNSLLK